MEVYRTPDPTRPENATSGARESGNPDEMRAAMLAVGGIDCQSMTKRARSIHDEIMLQIDRPTTIHPTSTEVEAVRADSARLEVQLYQMGIMA